MSIKLLPLRILQLVTKPLEGKRVFGKRIGDIEPLATIYEKTRQSFIPKDVVSEINGYKIKTNFSMGGIARAIVEDHIYEPLATRMFERYIEKGEGVVIDVGANIGYYTLFAARILREQKSKDEVYAIEPEVGNFTILCENMNLNHFTNIRTCPMALSDENGMAILYTSEKESGEHNIVGSHGLKDTNSDSYEVGIQTLDTWWFSSHPVPPIRLIKIDVEGAEVKVLKGGQRAIRDSHPVMIIECWEEGLNVAGNTIEELIARIRSYGYPLIYMIDEFESRMYDATPDLIREYYQKHRFSVNLLCLPE